MTSPCTWGRAPQFSPYEVVTASVQGRVQPPSPEHGGGGTPRKCARTQRTRLRDEVSARPAVRPPRDGRVDALRGVALLMMFVDHIPQNLLNRFTLRNIGFADAAEIFVLLAGFASMLAYGRVVRRAAAGASG